MARPLRIEFPGELYQGRSRGNERHDIALDDRGRGAFLAVLAEVRARFAGRPALGEILGPAEGLSRPERNRRIARATSPTATRCPRSPATAACMKPP